ncbi:nucleic acid-binding, OB-fold protein, partial [Tanacetum coccineum]
MADTTETTTTVNQQPEPSSRAATVVQKRKPVFVKVSDLKPGTNGHTLVVKVLTATTVLDKKTRNNTTRFSSGGGGHTRITECLIGDETGTVLFTARNDQ